MADETVVDSPSTTPEPAPAPATAEPEVHVGKNEIDRLTRENAEFKQNMAAQWSILDQLSQRQPPPPPSPEAGDGPPRRDQHPDDVTWLQALQQHQLEEFSKKVPEVIEKTLRERQQVEAQARRDAGIRDHVAKGRGSHHDFDQVIRAMPIDDLFLDMVGQFDDPHEITYTLGKNPTELARIMSLPPARRAYELGKVADKVRATAPATMEAIEPVQGHGATPRMRDTTSAASDKLSDKEWVEAERERMRAKLGG